MCGRFTARLTWQQIRDLYDVPAPLQRFPAQLMTAFPVSTKVNSVKNDTPDVIEPVEESRLL